MMKTGSPGREISGGWPTSDAAIDTGYDGWFGEDQFTYGTDPVKSMALSKELFANVMKKALLIYASRKELEKAQSTGDAFMRRETEKYGRIAKAAGLVRQ